MNSRYEGGCAGDAMPSERTMASGGLHSRDKLASREKT